MKFIFLAILPLLLEPLHAAQPTIFFSDLESGPNNGGQDNNGALITIAGKDFGSSQGASYVSVGGGQAVDYPVWTATTITFQLGPKAATGNIVVTTPEGDSNPVPFTVRSGKIYFVATNGGDHRNGSFHSPWRTLLHARDSIKPGDIVYAMDGVSQTTDDGRGWNTCFLIERGGRPGLPMAIVAYPHARVTMGDAARPLSAIRVKENVTADYWTFAGLILRGQNEAALIGGSQWRFVNNDLSCPEGNGASACFEAGGINSMKFFGNRVHDTGKATASALYQGVYFTTDSNHIEVGWNTIENIHGCRGIQFHSSPVHGGPSDPTGHNQYDISVHDNVIHDTQCDGIIFATVDPSRGKIEAYRNVIFNAGKGPNNPEHTGGWTCINIPGTTNNGPAGGGTVEIYDNTFYNCGSFKTPPYSGANASVINGGHNPNLKIRLRNNIFYEPSGTPYILGDRFSGSNNLFFGNGAAPKNPDLTNSITKDPLFTNPGAADFTVAPNSPARQYHLGARQ